MARFASSDSSIFSSQLHAFLKLAFVRIRVATGAAQILPVVDDGRLRLKLRRFLMTIAAWYGDVPPGKHEVCLFVLGESKRGRLVSLEIVTPLACIEVRRRRKLSRMPVAMAVCTVLKLDLKQRVLPLRTVALHTFQPRMPSLQRIRACTMFLHRERGRLPPIHCMARSALSTARTLRELPVVWIGHVA